MPESAHSVPSAVQHVTPPLIAKAAVCPLFPVLQPVNACVTASAWFTTIQTIRLAAAVPAYSSTALLAPQQTTPLSA
jgi:hypothetical protein